MFFNIIYCRKFFLNLTIYNKDNNMIDKLLLLLTLTTGALFSIPKENINTISSLDENKTFVKPQTLKELRNADPLEIAKLDKYDSRDYDIVTPVKKQFLNICWSYASMAASETSILREGLFESQTRSLDLSELNQSYRVFNNDPNLDPLYLTTGDSYSGGYDRGYHLYGSGQKMLTWQSPSFEAYDETYPSYGEADFLLEDIIHVDHHNIDDIKRAVARYGAVTVTYHITDYMEDYYYYNGNINKFDGDDHAVTIVGWDDTISKNAYPLASAMDGGWIVKNSWGTAHAEGDGYFAMSYDTPIKDTYAFDFAPKEKYDYNYHYDSYTLKEDYLMNNVPAAAIFPTRKDSLENQEFLKAVNVAILDTSPTKSGGEAKVTAEIYTDVSANEADIYSSDNNPTSSKTPVATISRNFDHEGSYTLELPKEIELNKGSYFSVVIKIEDPKDQYRVALSTETSTSNNDMTFYQEENGRWYNCGLPTLRHVARIKAFTKTKQREVPLENDLRYVEMKIDPSFKPRYGQIPDNIDVTLTNNGTRLQEGIDYLLEEVKITPKSDLDGTSSDYDIVATGTITATGIGAWHESISVSFPILVGFLDLNIFGENAFDGNEITLNADASHKNYKDIPLPENWSFLFPNDALNAGENTGNLLQYTGADKAYYRRDMYPVKVYKSNEIPSKINLSNAKVTLVESDFTYTANPHTPSVVVTLNDQVLTLNQDYRLNYENNINAGVAKVLVKGINQYEGTAETNFTIKKAANKITSFKIVNLIPKASALFGEVTFQYFKEEACLHEIAKPTEPGTYYIRAVVLETANYEGAISTPLIYEITKEDKPVVPEIPDTEPPASTDQPEVESPTTPDSSPSDNSSTTEKPTTPEPPSSNEPLPPSKKNNATIITVSIVASSVVVLLAVGVFIFVKKRK